MLRRTSLVGMKPYLHVFSPGRTAAEKGSLYRNSNQNAHARLANMQATQRTFSEDRKFKYLMLPEQSFYGVILVCCGFLSFLVTYKTMPLSGEHQRDKFLQGGVSVHERYIRRDEMSLIFEAHREAIENTRSEITQPPVFSPPGQYKSSSGVFQ